MHVWICTLMVDIYVALNISLLVNGRDTSSIIWDTILHQARERCSKCANRRDNGVSGETLEDLRPLEGENQCGTKRRLSLANEAVCEL